MANPFRKVKEVALIEAIKQGFKPRDPGVAVSIGDDTAVVQGSKGKYLLYTTDMLIEGVHFKKGEDPARVGYKALAVSVSDIAAMAGVPKYALVSVGLPKNGTERIARGLYRGLKRCASKFGVDIIGGDTNRSERLIIDCFVAGEVEKDKVTLRSGARVGDYIFVSGPLGGSLRGRHLCFEPRVKEARFLAAHFKPSSMIDLSDGLGMDLNRIAEASGVGALIFESKIPRNKGVKNVVSALFDGEDFELLFTLPKPRALALLHWQAQGRRPFSFHLVGRVTDLFRGVRLLTAKLRIEQVACKGFQHFS